jgi:2-acylglycerol O-acyltransferase 2
MAAPTAAPLNAEPTLPEERKKQHLPPKSYADAVEEEPPASSINGANSTNNSSGMNGVGDEGSKTAHMASVVRIIDTGAPDTKEKQEERPHFERQESKHEYSATVSSPTPFAH